MNWRILIEPFTRPLFFAYSRLTRGMTLGVRGIALDGEGRVLLVKHTYLAGWWLPGGGVDRGETLSQAVLREMREEAGLVCDQIPKLLSIHSNEKFFPGDHVAIFLIKGFEMEARNSQGEIAEIGWFNLDDLPEDTTRATRDRLAEALQARPPSDTW